MKKIMITLIFFTFISVATAQNDTSNFTLQKANTASASLFSPGKEGGNKLSCAGQCKADLYACMDSSTPSYICFDQFDMCLFDCGFL
jgi:hypothetical protein